MKINCVKRQESSLILCFRVFGRILALEKTQKMKYTTTKRVIVKTLKTMKSGSVNGE
jgi:hypothetical protein